MVSASKLSQSCADLSGSYEHRCGVVQEGSEAAERRLSLIFQVPAVEFGPSRFPARHLSVRSHQVADNVPQLQSEGASAPGWRSSEKNRRPFGAVRIDGHRAR